MNLGAFCKPVSTLLSSTCSMILASISFSVLVIKYYISDPIILSIRKEGRSFLFKKLFSVSLDV